MKTIFARRRKALGVIALLIACAFASSCSRSAKAGSSAAPRPDPVTAAVVRAEPRDLSRKLILAAEFRPFQEVDVHAKVAGYVKDIYVDYGYHVKEGQLLAVLEVPEMADQVAEQKAQVRHDEEDVATAQANVASAKAVYRMQRLNYTRLAAAAKARPNLIAQQEIDDALAQDQVAQAKVQTALSSLAASAQALDSDKDSAKRLEDLYSYSYITAPFTGVVTKRYADVGSMIQEGTNSETQAMPIVRLSQNDLLRLVIPVPESVVPLIHVGTRVSVRIPGLNRTITGTVSRFADKVELSTRTMHTEVDVPNPDYKIVPGMYAYVTLILERRNDALSIPIQAIRRRGGSTYVLTVDGAGKVAERRVKTGLEMPDQVEILSGLTAGEEVVVGGAGSVQPGETVTPVPVHGD